MLINSYRFASATTIWTPAQITTSLWLDGADNTTVFSDAGTTQAVGGLSTVQQWNDKSGNSRHVSQPTPSHRPNYANAQIGSKAALDWGASLNTKSLTRDSMSFSPARYYGVALYTGPNPFPNYCGLISHNLSDEVDLFLTNSSSTEWYGGATAYLNGASASTATALPAVISPFIFATNFSASSNRSTVYIGRDRTEVNRAWLGSIGEIIATPSVPTDAIKQKLEGYLAHKWGLTANLPAGHPYKSAAPTV